MDDGLPLVGVIGAGTMGAGIAQVAAVAGHRVLLADAVDGAAGRAVDRIRERVKAQVAKGRLDADPDALDLTATEISETGRRRGGRRGRRRGPRRQARGCSRSSSSW